MSKDIELSIIIKNNRLNLQGLKGRCKNLKKRIMFSKQNQKPNYEIQQIFHLQLCIFKYKKFLIQQFPVKFYLKKMLKIIQNKLQINQQIFLKMEEDNQEISGWDDQQFNILDNKSFLKTKKKPTQSLPTQNHFQRKLKSSQTLPLIKNLRKSLINQYIDQKQKYEDQEIEKIIKKMKKKMDKSQGITVKENEIKNTTIKQIIEHQNLQRQKLIKSDLHTVETLQQNKKLYRIKHSNTVLKQNDELSNFRRLKMEIKQYSSTPKNLSFEKSQNRQRSKQLLMKLKQNFSKDLGKNSKSKHFFVKKQKLSPQKHQEEISKIAIESRRSCDDENIKFQQKDTQILKERYKNIVKTIEVGRKSASSSIMNSKSQQLSRFSNQKKKKNKTQFLNSFDHQEKQGKILKSDYVLEKTQNLLFSKRLMDINSQILESDLYPKIKRSNKLSKNLKRSQKSQIVLNSKNERSINILKLSDQLQRSHLVTGDISMRKAQNLCYILAQRQKNVTNQRQITTQQHEQLSSQKQKKKLSWLQNNRINKKLSSQPFVLDEFNDQSIFVHR